MECVHSVLNWPGLDGLNWFAYNNFKYSFCIQTTIIKQFRVWFFRWFHFWMMQNVTGNSFANAHKKFKKKRKERKISNCLMRNVKIMTKRNSFVFLLFLIVTRYWIRVNYATKQTLRMRISMDKKTLTLLLAYTSRLTDRIKSHFHQQTSSLKRWNRRSFQSTKAVRHVCSCSLNTARSSCFFFLHNN